jgi:hypothetical protein
MPQPQGENVCLSPGSLGYFTDIENMMDSKCMEWNGGKALPHRFMPGLRVLKGKIYPGTIRFLDSLMTPGLLC